MSTVVQLCCLLACIVFLSYPRVALAAAPEIYEQAYDQFRQQKFRQAYLLLKSSLDEEPGHLPSKLLMGKVLLLEGLIVDAGKEFEEALMMGADPNLVVPDLLQVYLLSGQYDRVIQYKNENLSPRVNADVALFRANAYDNLDSATLAEAQFKEALSFSTDARFLNSYAAFLLRRKRLDDADKWVSRAYAQYPSDPRTLHLKGMQATLNGEHQTALNWFEQAHQQDSQDPVVKRSLVFAHIRLGQRDKAEVLVDEILAESENDPVLLLAKASIMSAKGEGDTASGIIESLSNKLTVYQASDDPSDALLPLIRGVTHYLTGQYQNSANQLEQYVASAEPDKNAINLLAQVYVRLGSQRKARVLLERYLTLTTANARLTSMLCSLYIETNKDYFCENLLKQVDPAIQQTATIRLLHVRLLREQGKFAAAIQTLESLFPPPVPLSATVELAQLHALNNDPDAALRQIQILTDSAPDNTDFLRMKADILLSKNDLEAAASLIAKLQRIAPEQPFSDFLQAKYLIKTGKYTRAETLLSQLAETAPEDPDVAVTYSKVLTQLGKEQEALTHLEQFRKKHGDTADTQETLAMLYTRQGLYDTALKEVEALRRNNIDSPKYIQGKINLLLKLNDHVSARQEIARLQQLLPESSDTTLMIAQYKTRAEDPVGALESINLYLAKSGATDRLLLEKANLQLKLNRAESVMETLAPLLGTSKSQPAAYFLAAKAKQTLGDPDAAFALYSSGFKETDGSAVYAQGMFETALNTDTPDDFADTLEAFITSAPTDKPYLHYLLAEFYSATGATNKARQRYEQYLSFSDISHRALALIRLAQLELPDGLVKSHELAAQSYALSPNNAEILSTYGWTFALQQQYQPALYHLRESLAMDADNSETLYKLGFVLAKLNKGDEALTHLKRAQEATPPDKFAIMAKNLAQEIEK